jgi:pilus assembly protein CpaE
MTAAALAKEKRASARRSREGIVVVAQDQLTLNTIEGTLREVRSDERLSFETTLDSALYRLREGAGPRVLVLDISESSAPIAEISAARNTGGSDLKIVVIGSINDVGLYRDLVSSGANDYLVKPVGRDGLGAALYKRGAAAEGGDELGQVVTFIGSRGGVGTTTTAVSCAWLLAEKRQQKTVLFDLDLHYGTAALQLDTDPGHGLCEGIEPPSRIDSLFIDRVMLKISDHLSVMAAEADISRTLLVDAGAISVLLYELRQKFAWVLVDLPRGGTPTQHAVLAATSHIVLLCERSLAGLRDTIRLQTLLRERASQAQILLIEGACGDRHVIGKADFEKAVGKSLDGFLPYDTKLTSAAANEGLPLPAAAPRSLIVCEIEKLTAMLAGPAAAQKPRWFGFA